MHYTVQQLIERALSGQIGERGLHRLTAAGIDPSGLASSGVDPSGVPDPAAALDIRHEGNYLKALLRARLAKQAGQPVGAATQARIASGYSSAPGVSVSGDPYNGDQFQAMLAATASACPAPCRRTPTTTSKWQARSHARLRARRLSASGRSASPCRS
jgi:hypothetical protein